MANKNLYVESLGVPTDRYWPCYATYYLCFKHAVRATLANIEVGEIIEEWNPECCFCGKKESIDSIKEKLLQCLLG